MHRRSNSEEDENLEDDEEDLENDLDDESVNNGEILDENKEFHEN